MKVKVNELREKSVAELKEALVGVKEKLGELCFRVSTRELKNVREIRKLKQQVARLLTILREKA